MMLRRETVAQEFSTVWEVLVWIGGGMWWSYLVCEPDVLVVVLVLPGLFGVFVLV